MSILNDIALNIKELIPNSIIDYVPNFELKDFKGEKVVIVPTSTAYINETRGKKEVLLDYQIGIAKRIKETEIVEMIDRVEQIITTLLNAKVADGSGYIKEVVNSQAYDIQAMTTASTFLSIIQVQVRVIV